MCTSHGYLFIIYIYITSTIYLYTYTYIYIYIYIYKISSDSYHKSNDTCGYLQQVVPAMITLPYEIYPGTGL